MTQGDELREKLDNVLTLIRESENNYIERTTLEAQIKQQAMEKAEMSFAGGKGKAKLIAMAVGIYILVLLLLATIIQGWLGTWIVVAIAATICFVCIGKRPVIGFLAGAVTVFMACYMIYWCVIYPTINAFATGNIPGIVIPLVMVAILVLVIYLANHRFIRKENEKIRQANDEILINNGQIFAQLQSLYARAMELDRALRSQLTPNGFYPQQYVYEHAAAAFVGYMRNMERGTMVTMPLLIEMYKQDTHRQREVEHWHKEEAHWKRTEDLIAYYGDNILQNQEEIKQSLHLQNIISLNNAIQLSAQNAKLDAISRKMGNVNVTGTINIR